MNKKQFCKAVAAANPGMVCQWKPDTSEYRVAFRGNEASAYYTNDQDDAAATARHMWAERYAPKESLVESRTHFDFNDPTHPAGVQVPNPLYRHLLPGDVVQYEVAAPGRGRITYRITRTDEQGAWGVMTANTVREMTAEEVR